MSLETITGGSMKSVSALQPGESFSGFLKGAIKEKNKFDSDQWNLLMEDENGLDFKILTGGTAKYFAQNVAMALGLEPASEAFAAAVDAAKRTIGKWIVITQDGSYVNKRKQTVKKYKIQMDSTKTQSETVEGNAIPF